MFNFVHNNMVTAHFSCDEFAKYSFLLFGYILQGEHKVFPKETTVRGIQTYFFLNVTQEVFYNTLVHFNMCSFCCTQNV